MSKVRLISLVAILAVLSLTLAGCMSGSTFENIKNSDLQKLIDSGEKFTLVDIREADTFKKGHIPNAINIPFSKFQERYKELEPKAKIVLICYSGGTSQSAAQFLLEKGYTNVSSVTGGMEAWRGVLTK